MKSLLRAVRFALVSDGAIVAANTGGVFTGTADTHAQLPYLVATGVGTFVVQYYTNLTAQLEQITVRFQAWSTDIDGAMSTVQQIEKIFRSANVALDSGTVVCTTKGNGGIEMDPDPTNEGHDVYMGIIDLIFLVQRDPTA